jgi:FMN phosphatase YigB (HAD superfamily)
MVTPRAWLVDLDGTLYDARWVKLGVALELLCGHWGALPVVQEFRREHERVRHELREPVPDPFALQLERAAAQSGRSRKQVEAIVAEWLFRRPGKWLRRFRRKALLEELRGFKALGGRAALVSDYPATQKLAALGVADLFDAVVASGEAGGPGRLKPWPDGYLLAAQRLGVGPAECLVLGDRDDLDGEAARRAGMAFRRVGG